MYSQPVFSTLLDALVVPTSEVQMERNAAAAELARKALLQYIRREPTRLYQVGHVSLWLRGGYSLERTEELMESLVEEGILRLATKEELAQVDAKFGYKLTEAGLHLLPPEDRSYGVL